VPDWGVPLPDADTDSDRNGLAAANLHAAADRDASNRTVVHANEHRHADLNAHVCAKRHARGHRGAPADRIARRFPDARLIANPATLADRSAGCPLVCSRRRIGRTAG
jgi:hypothetical protein